MPRIKLTSQIALNLSGTSSNLLVVGPTGSGKTFLLCHLLLSLYGQRCVVYVVDFKQGDFYGVVRWHTKDGADYCASTADEFEEILDLIRDTLRIRFQKLASPNTTFGRVATDLVDDWRPVYLFVDEYSAALAPLLTNKETKSQANRINAKMLEIIQLIRQAGGGVILSFQKMAADILPTAITDNMAKIGLGNLSTQSKVQLFGKATNLPIIDLSQQGVGYLQRPEDPIPLPFQAPQLHADKIQEIAETLTGFNSIDEDVSIERDGAEI